MVGVGTLLLTVGLCVSIPGSLLRPLLGGDNDGNIPPCNDRKGDTLLRGDGDTLPRGDGDTLPRGDGEGDLLCEAEGDRLGRSIAGDVISSGTILLTLAP